MKNDSRHHSCFIFPRGSRRVRECFFVLAAFCFLISCERFDFLSKPYVAVVNGSKIYLDDFRREVERKENLVPEEVLNQPENRRHFEEEVLDGMIAEKVMLSRAQELHLTVSDQALENKIEEMKRDYGEDFTNLFQRQKVDFESWKEQLRKEMLLQKLVETDVNSKIAISDAEAEDYYNRHRDDYKTEARVRVLQIVVRDMASAEAARRRLEAGEDFAKVAAEVSIAPEAKQGGDLGFVTRWMMPEPLDRTIFKMKVNTVSPIVKSSYGYHIFKVVENQPARSRSFQEARQDVLADLRMQKEDDAFNVWLEALKKKAVIKRYEKRMFGAPNK